MLPWRQETRTSVPISMAENLKKEVHAHASRAIRETWRLDKYEWLLVEVVVRSQYTMFGRATRHHSSTEFVLDIDEPNRSQRPKTTMKEAAVQPNGIPCRLHELVRKIFVFVDALDQRVPVDVALGVSAHRRIQVEEGHLARWVGDRLAVDDK